MKGKYYHTEDSVEEYIKLAKDVNGASLIHKLKRYLPIESKLLEIGSGPGSDWDILNDDYDVTGSDNSTIFINHLNSSFPEGVFYKLDAVTLETALKFDGIYSNKVLHHLDDTDLAKSIQRQYEILTPDGIICHSFWSGEGSEIFKGLFVNYHSKASLNQYFGRHFELVLLETYDEFDSNDSFLLIGKKKSSIIPG